MKILDCLLPLNWDWWFLSPKAFMGTSELHDVTSLGFLIRHPAVFAYQNISAYMVLGLVNCILGWLFLAMYLFGDLWAGFGLSVQWVVVLFELDLGSHSSESKFAFFQLLLCSFLCVFILNFSAFSLTVLSNLSLPLQKIPKSISVCPLKTILLFTLFSCCNFFPRSGLWR